MATGSTTPGDTTANTYIVIPAFNEEASLPEVLSHLKSVVPQLHVVVVDDGSSDGTFEVAREAGVHALRLPFNLGIGGALRAGFRFAAEQGAERAVQFDADGQHDAHQIAAPADRPRCRCPIWSLAAAFRGLENTRWVAHARREWAFFGSSCGC